MGDVIPFPGGSRPRLVQPSRIETFSVQDVLNVTMGNDQCRHCAGRGWIFTADRHSLSVGPCPCGGDDENRIDPDEPDYPGAA